MTTPVASAPTATPATTLKMMTLLVLLYLSFSDEVNEPLRRSFIYASGLKTPNRS